MIAIIKLPDVTAVRPQSASTRLSCHRSSGPRWLSVEAFIDMRRRLSHGMQKSAPPTDLTPTTAASAAIDGQTGEGEDRYGSAGGSKNGFEAGREVRSVRLSEQPGRYELLKKMAAALVNEGANDRAEAGDAMGTRPLSRPRQPVAGPRQETLNKDKGGKL